MIRLLIATALGGALGLWAHGHLNSPDYVVAWRVVTLGALLLGFLGTSWWVWIGTEGWRRWAILICMVVVLRICYLPILELSLIMAAWLEQLAAKVGKGTASVVVHCGWGAFVAGLSALAALMACKVVTHLRRWTARIVIGLLIGQGIFAFSTAEDRTLSPQPFQEEEQSKVAVRPGYKETLKDSDRPMRTRLVAAAGVVLDAITPSSGWGGAVRDSQEESFKHDLDASSRERVAAIEDAFVNARWTLRTSPDNPQPS